MTEEVKQNPFLNQLVSVIKEGGPKEEYKQLDFQRLNEEAGNLIQNLELRIDRCKRYNEVKIGGKYHMIITDLENQVRKLNEKLKIEQDFRSPTKRHVTDILDQLLAYRDQNIVLKKQLSELKQKYELLERKDENQAAALLKLQTVQPKNMIERLPAINSGCSITQTIKQYLKEKQKIRSLIGNTQKSNLEKFLHSQQAKSWNWTVGNLLQELDKWGEGIKPSKHVDMWKIRSSVAKSFSKYLDDSSSLTRPTSLPKHPKHPLSPIHSQPRGSHYSISTHRRQASYFDLQQH